MIQQRVEQIIKLECAGNKRAFALRAGISPSAVENIVGKRGGKPSFDVLEKILLAFANINADWLMTGRGDMHVSHTSDVVVSNDFRLRTDRTQDSQRVPLYELEAAASFISLFNGNGVEPIDYLVIPDLPPCDGAMYVRGDSMYPLLKSGDIALYKRITDYQFGILWGEIHIVSYELDGEEYILIKYVQKSDIDKCVRLVSYNQHHSSQDIPFEKIRAIALVKASVRYNTLG